MWFTAAWAAIRNFFSGTSLHVIIIILLLILGFIGYFYWHHLEQKISSLQQQNASLHSTITTQDQTITQLQKRFKQIQEDMNQLNKNYQIIQTNTAETESGFNFGTITSGNEKTVEKQINHLYNDIFENLTKETTSFSKGK